MNYEAGIACVLYGKQGACKTTKTNKRSYPYITQKGEYRECNPCQYIANIKDKTVTGYKYLDLSDAAGIIASVSGRARGKLRLFTQIDGDCIGEIDMRPNTRRAKTGIRFSLAESALYFRFEGSGKLNLLNSPLQQARRITCEQKCFSRRLSLGSRDSRTADRGRI